MNKLQSLPSASHFSLRSGWKVMKFGDIAENIAVRVKPSEADTDIYVGLEHLDPETLHLKKWGQPSDVEGDKLRFWKGDIIFGRRRAYQRKLAITEFDGICSAHAMVVRAKPKIILPEFLPFFLQSDMFMERAIGISVGSLSPTINWKTLREEEFPLPSLDEQKRIAEILWAADEALEALIQVARGLVNARQLFIDKLIPDPELAKVNPVIELKALCSMQNGRPFQSSNYSESGFRLLRPGNLASDGKLTWSPNATVCLAYEYAETNSDWIVRPGDVVINLTAQSLEDGFMGRVCLAAEGDDSLLNQRLGRFLCEDNILSEYLFRVLQTSRFRKLVEARCEGSKVRHIYFRHFADMPVVLLDSKGQRDIIEATRRIDKARDAALSAVSTARDLSKQLVLNLLCEGRVTNGGH